MYFAGKSSTIPGSCWCGIDEYCLCSPSLAIDIVIESYAPGSNKFRGIYVVQRKNYPFGLATVGGFVEVGESLEEATRREVFEETGLQLGEIELLNTYSNPKQDPRRHTVTIAYVGTTTDTPVAGDDAATVLLLQPDVDAIDAHHWAFGFHRTGIISDYLVRHRHQN
jgi:8-oxo-dGTP diphosphatase